MRTSDEASRALGEAVVRIWAQLPPGIQQHLFEEAVAFEGEAIRSRLAVYLHGRHPRTSASMIMRAMVEPDSLGG